MTQNPNIIVTPMGPQYLTAPDGTTAPDVAGTPVDLTGVPLTVAPSFAAQKGLNATITAFAAGTLTVSGLSGNMSPADVGRRLVLLGAQEGNTAGTGVATFVTGLTGMSAADVGKRLVLANMVSPANNGSFVISQVIDPTVVRIINPAFVAGDANTGQWKRSPVGIQGNNGRFSITAFVDAVTVKVANAAGMFPDAFSGNILWQEIPGLTDFPPGDPLSVIAARDLELNVNALQGPPGFGDFDPILPPEIGAGSVNPVPMNTGAGDPSVSPPPGSLGPVSTNDPQAPVRTVLSATIPNMPDGQAQVMTDGPAVVQLGVVQVVQDPALTPHVA